jgi:hypothetical protein
MAQNVVSGYAAYVNYGYEATYGTGVTGTRVFGHGNKVTLTRKNNMDKIFGLGSRNATALAAKKYEGSARVEFVMANGSFFRSILGTVADGGVSGAYTHTYTETNTIPSMTIASGTEMGTNDEVATFVGAKVMTATITAAQNELVKVVLECPYKTETLATSGIGSQVAETEEPFTFAQGTLQLPSGATIGYVQNVELTVNNTLEGVWGLGSRLLQAQPEKIREYTFKMSIAFSDVSVFLTKFLGASGAPAAGTPAPSASLVLTFTNGLSNPDGRSVVMTFANIYLDDESLPKDVNDIIKEDVTAFAFSCTNVVYTNNTQVDVGSP